MRTPSIRVSRAGLLLFGLAASVMIGACGDDNGETATTTVPATQPPST